MLDYMLKLIDNKVYRKSKNRRRDTFSQPISTPTMRNFTIFTRLGLGYLVILLIVITLGAYSTSKFYQLNQITRSISFIDSKTIRVANRLRDAIISQRGFDKKYVVSEDRDFHRQFLEAEEYIRKDLEKMGALMDTAEEKRLIADIRESYDRYRSKVREEVRLIKIGRGYPRERYEKEKEDFTNIVIRNLLKIMEISELSTDNKIHLSEKIGSRASRIMVVITIGSVFMAILIAFFNARTINRPISLLIKGTREIARGKFEKHLSIPSPPEINELAHAFNHMCDRLKELDDMKADLISRISHEFRTPLTVIREAVNLQIDCISAGSVEKQHRLIGIIEEECERLITSVGKILDLSQMEAGMMDYHMEECSLPDLIEISVSKIRPIAERKGISLTVNLESNLPYTNMDTEKIGEVLDNLLDNALKFTPERGRVSITAYLKKDEKTSEHPPDKASEFIEVSISDTGPGHA